ncbi:MAG: hypothetical protein M0R21_11630 [Lentimicrobiaceae bacterium]|nr:hypothetical protein [Lentimicrobiaceae bacterium]
MKFLFRHFILTALLCAVILTCGAGNGRSILQNVSDEQNVKIADSVATYKGEELFYLIDGGAELYLEYGFTEASVAEFVFPEDGKLRAELYEMSDVAAAYGVFSVRCGSPGSMSLEESSIAIGDGYVFAWKNNFFIQLSSEGSSVDNIEIKQFTIRLLNRINSGNGFLPGLLKEIPDTGLKNSLVKYFRGPIALQNIYYFGQGNIFEFSEGICAETADSTLFIFLYPSAEKCLSGFQNAKEKLALTALSGITELQDGFSYADKKGNKIYVQKFDTSIRVKRIRLTTH